MRPIIDLVALILVIIGGVNWGLIGAFNFDLVATVLAAVPILVKLIYVLVGVSAIYVAVTRFVMK